MSHYYKHCILCTTFAPADQLLCCWHQEKAEEQRRQIEAGEIPEPSVTIHRMARNEFTIQYCL